MPKKLNWTLLYDKKFPNQNNFKSFCYSQLVSFIDKIIKPNLLIVIPIQTLTIWKYLKGFQWNNLRFCRSKFVVKHV